MLSRYLDSLIGNLGTSQFSDELRQLVDELDSLLKDLPDSTGSGSRKSSTKEEEIPKDSNSWSMKEFRGRLHSLARDDGRFNDLPARIDLSGLGSALDRLSQQAQDGLEYGRMAYVRHWDGKLELGNTSCGKDQVKIECILSPLKSPAIMIHTHPPISGNVLSPCHFSPQDFISFLAIPQLQASIVIAPRASLLMVKTDRTPEFGSIPHEYFDSIYERVNSDFLVPHRSKQARATQIICRELDIGLFLRKQDANDFTFQQIELKGGA